jgi:hypothetical protein
MRAVAASIREQINMSRSHERKTIPEGASLGPETMDEVSEPAAPTDVAVQGFAKLMLARNRARQQADVGNG